MLEIFELSASTNTMYNSKEISSQLVRSSFVCNLFRNKLNTKRDLQQNYFITRNIIQRLHFTIEFLLQQSVSPIDGKLSIRNISLISSIQWEVEMIKKITLLINNILSEIILSKKKLF